MKSIDLKCVWWVVAFSCCVPLPAMGDAPDARPNVLFIAIDDLRPELGCYGVAAADSPHLDRLARSGVLFDRHYVQVATCGASRYALLTGRSPARSGVTRNNAAAYSGDAALQDDPQPGAQSMPELFRRAGYRTVCIGKISHTPDGRVYAYDGSGDGRAELPGGWDELATPMGAWQRGWGIFFAYSGGRHREDGQGHQDLMEFRAERDEDLPDGLLAAAAVDQLRRLKEADQPFFLGLGFFKPHLPFVAPRQDWQALAEVAIPLPPQDKVDSPYWHKSGEFYRYDAPFAKSHPLPAEAQQQSRRAYLACVRYVDRQVGRVLDALDQTGLAENTIVVVWGDHGWHLGDHQLWAKHTPFERANRSVLMIRAPGVSVAGTRSSALVETIDLYPTLIELCQPRFTATHWPLDGVSLVPILRGTQDRVRDAAVSYWADAVTVRTATHRLVTRMRRGKREGDAYTALYDLSDNLDNLDDIAADHPELVQQMLRHLPQ